MAQRFDQIELSHSGNHLHPYITGTDGYLAIHTTTGLTRIGSGNTSWTHIFTDRPNFYFSQGASFDGNIAAYGGTHTASFATYYDSNNTAYYVNPAGTSVLNDVEIVQAAFDGYLYHRGDTDTYFGFSGANSMKFVAGGTERMAITGDVHIQGTTDLSINGTSRRISFTAGTGTIRTTTANDLILQTNSTTAITIDSNQNTIFSQPVWIQDYIYHHGDSNTYFGFNGADSWKLHVGGGDRLVVSTTTFTSNLPVDLGSGGASIKKSAGGTNGNHAAIELYSSGTADSGSAIAIQQMNNEGDTIIFADYPPHVEWGISTENSNNEIQFTAGNTTGTMGSKTLYNDSGTARTAYKKMIFVLGTGVMDVGGSVRAPLFYDLNNTAYYTNPAGTSVMNDIELDDYIYHKGDTDTYFGFNGADQFVMVLGGTTRFTSVNNGASFNFAAHISMGNHDIDYVNQLHFNDNVRFYDNGDDSYLNFKFGDTGNGGIKMIDGSGNLHGYFYADGDDSIGILDADGHWAVQVDKDVLTGLKVNNVYRVKANTSGVLLGADNAASKTIVRGHLGIGDATYPKIAYPGQNALWSGSGSTTGQIVIDLPGTLANYDMAYIEIDIYEYSGAGASKLIIGGHNWNSGGNSNTSTTQWYNVNVQVVGPLSKAVYFGRRNDGSNERRCIAIGETTSTWSYATVHVAKAHGAEFYSTGMDWVGDWNIAQTTSTSYFTKNPTTNFNDGGSYTLESNGIIEANHTYGSTSARSPIFYDLNNTSYYVDPSATGTAINVAGEYTASVDHGNAGFIQTWRNTNTGTGAYVEHLIGNGAASELRVGHAPNYGSADWNASWVYAVGKPLFLKSSSGNVEIYAGGAGSANKVATFDSSKNTTLNGDINVGNIRIVGDNDSADQQTAWIRSNGDYLVLNAVDGEHVYLNWDTGGGGSGHVYVENYIYATAFFDRNDTNYYVDPSDQSRMKYLNLGTSPTSGISSGYIAQFRGSLKMTNNPIDYVSQLHFNDNVRFYQTGGDNYVAMKWGDANYGGIRFENGGGTVKGYVYGDNGGFGILDNDGNWALRTQTGTNPLQLRCNDNNEFEVYEDHTLSVGSSRAPIFYDSDDTNYYVNPATDSALNTINGVRKNWASSESWSVTTGNLTGHYGGSFGGTDNRDVKYLDGPYGTRELVLETVPDSGNDYDGGWEKTITGLDINKAYMSIVYVKRITSSTSGSFYHGCSANSSRTLNLDGSGNGNPYFVATGISNLPENVWCVSIGYIQANNDSNTSQAAYDQGIYRMDTGQKIVSSTVYKMGGSGATQVHRSFLYYSSDNASKIQLARPGFYEVNGHHPTLNEILSNADTVDNLHVKSQSGQTGADQVLRSASNGYFYHKQWMDVGSAGLFSTTANSAHFYPNTGSDYGAWRMSGSRNSWNGIAFNDGNGNPNCVLMAETQTMGFYNDADNEWMVEATRNGAVTLYNNGSGKLSTISDGINVTGKVVASVRVDSPIFYDGNDTNYYLNPASTSNINGLDVKGQLLVANNSNPAVIVRDTGATGAGASPWIQFQDSGGTNLGYVGYGSSGSSNLYIVSGQTTGNILLYNTTTRQTITTTYSEEAGSYRAPIFYDSADTNYYVDPANTGSSVYVKGDVVAYGASDERLKDNIKPIENALDKVCSLSGNTFEWNEISHRPTGKKDIGVIAQEVEKVFPEIIDTRDTGYKAVDYQKLSAVLIEAIKELKQEVKELKCGCDGCTC